MQIIGIYLYQSAMMGKPGAGVMARSEALWSIT